MLLQHLETRLPVKAAIAVGKNHKVQMMMTAASAAPLTPTSPVVWAVVVGQKIAIVISNSFYVVFSPMIALKPY